MPIAINDTNDPPALATPEASASPNDDFALLISRTVNRTAEGPPIIMTNAVDTTTGRPSFESFRSDSSTTTQSGRRPFAYSQTLDSLLPSAAGSTVALIPASQSKNANNASALTARRGDPSKAALRLPGLSRSFESRNTLQFYKRNETRQVLSQTCKRFELDVAELENSMTALHWAAAEGDEQEVTRLLGKSLLFRPDRTVDVVRSPLRCTPLHIAVACGHVHMVTSLLQQQANVDLKDRYELTPLHWAAATGSISIVRLLLDHNADVNTANKARSTPLHIAARLGHVEVLRLLLSHGADVHTPTNLGHTALHLAAAVGQASVARLLLQNGAHVHERDYHQSTPLHLAAWESHVEVADVLLNGRAEFHKGDHLLMTPLHLAAKKGNPLMVELLIKNGARLDLQDKNKATPLHHAAKHGQILVSRLLMLHGANVNAIDFNYRTPLHYAAQLGHDNVVSALIELGYGPSSASTDPRDGAGNTPLHLAASKPSVSAVRVLLDNGADINAVTFESRRTPLHLAAQIWTGREIVALLFAKGADKSLKDRNGRTPMDILKGHSAREALKEEWGIRSSFGG